MIEKFKRYLSLWWAFFKFSFHAETAFRGNLAFWSLENLLWLGLSFVGVELIFGQVEAIAGWTKPEVLLLIFIGALFHDLCWTLLFRNLGNFSRLIRQGDLDQNLLKPINSRFLLSFQVLEFDHYIRILLELALIYRFTMLITGSFSLVNLLGAVWLFGWGLIIFYSLFFTLTITNIWLVNLENLVEFFHDLKALGEKPTYIFKKGLFFFFTFVLPVGYIATFPAEALLGRADPVKVALAPVLAGIFLWVSQAFFRFALKHYSSASS